MNTRQLADKILSVTDCLHDRLKARSQIEALLTEFSKESFKEGLDVGRETLHEHIAKEREACAKVCEDWNCGSNVTKKVNLTLVAAQIRRRGEGK